jgi:pyrroline-5-carboxylate reductase
MTIHMQGRLVLVGAGKMGSAMLEGWLNNGLEPSRVVIFDPTPPPESAHLIAKHAIAHNPAPASITDAQVVLIAVKPQVMEAVLPPLVCMKAAKPLILSVAAGKTIASFARHFGEDAAIIRTIPNTPAAIGRGITAMAANANVSPDQMQLAETLLSAVGEVVRVEREEMIDAVTALSGSGPAYVFLLTECLAAAGAKLGLSEAMAMQLARATVAGAGELMRQSGTPAATLRQNVTSPKGTTYAALEILMGEQGMQALFDKALAAAEARSRELAS